jgi:GPH family glycoside/pentoside/hexuronide:cation symporter
LEFVQPPPAPDRHLSLSTRLFYGLGSVAFGVKDNGFSFLLLLFYNQVVGLSATKVGLAILIAMVVDAFFDPIVGQISDNWRSRWGRRHPFMYAAALPVAVSYLLLWSPPHWSKDALFYYLIGVAIVIRTFITFYEVPSSALAAELSSGYDERTVLLSYRYFFAWVGGLALYLVTFTFLLVPDAHHATGQTNPIGFAKYGLLASVIMFAAIIISSAGTHRHIPSFRVPPRRKMGVFAVLKEMAATWSNRSFLFLTLSGLATSMAAGVTASMNIYINTFFWELSSKQFALLVLGVFISAFLALGAAAPLSRRFGKRNSAMAMTVLALTIGLAPITLRLLNLMPPNHTPAVFAIVLVQSIVSTSFTIAASTLVSAMIADVVEDGELKTGRRSEGLFFSASTLVTKAVSGIGIFAASTILALVHFPAGAKPGLVPEAVIRHLGLVYVPTLIVLHLFGLALLLGYGITRASHTETLTKLAAKAERVTAT